MEIMDYEGVSFGWRDMLTDTSKNGRKKKISDGMLAAAERAYNEGLEVLTMRCIVELYTKEEEDENWLTISGSGCFNEKLYIGPRIGYLSPANEIAVALCTVGPGLVSLMNKYSAAEDYLVMYYLDVFGVRALAEVSAKMRSHLESVAAEKGWGVGPSMQPGAVAGWAVEGQRDLCRLAHGEKIGLTLNDASFLIPHISNSTLIGLGPHYDAAKVGSMCHECPRKNTCLWRRDNVSE